MVTEPEAKKKKNNNQQQLTQRSMFHNILRYSNLPIPEMYKRINDKSEMGKRNAIYFLKYFGSCIIAKILNFESSSP